MLTPNTDHLFSEQVRIYCLTSAPSSKWCRSISAQAQGDAFLLSHGVELLFNEIRLFRYGHVDGFSVCAFQHSIKVIPFHQIHGKAEENLSVTVVIFGKQAMEYQLFLLLLGEVVFYPDPLCFCHVTLLILVRDQRVISVDIVILFARVLVALKAVLEIAVSDAAGDDRTLFGAKAFLEASRTLAADLHGAESAVESAKGE